MKEREEALNKLKELFEKAGYRAYTILRHVSRSGMLRRISVFLIIDNQPLEIDYLIVKAGMYKRGKEEGLKVTGCGMDMGFSIVYNVSSRVFADKKDGGYMVSHKWL